MHIFWFSNAPWVSTGYGTQTRVNVPRIKALGHKVTLGANYGLQGAMLSTGDGDAIYPLGLERSGNDVIGAHATHCKADIVITLYDSWAFRAHAMSAIRWCPWAPVDHEPIPTPVKQALGMAWQPIAYSLFGQREMQNAGLDAAYVPHCLEMDQYAPGDQYESRERLGLPQDVFVAAMVAANKGVPSRKSFPEAFMAWKAFLDESDHKDAVLYLHTYKGPEMTGLDLEECLEAVGVPKANVVFCDQYHNILGFPSSYMVDVYRAADVLLSPSMGEGFGLPILEAQACGCPVIVGDWTSMPELCFAGWKVHGQRFYTPIGSFQYIPNIRDITWALRDAYAAKGNAELREQARQGALAYDADLVAETYWKPVLTKIEEEIASATGDPVGTVLL